MWIAFLIATALLISSTGADWVGYVSLIVILPIAGLFNAAIILAILPFTGLLEA